MSTEQNYQKDLVDTTDCLEAVGVFKCWKNLFFVVVLLGLLLLGLCFWIMELGLVSAEPEGEQAVTVQTTTEQLQQATPAPVNEVKRQVDEAAALVTAEPAAAGQVAGDANAAATTGTETEVGKPIKLPFTPRKAQVVWAIRALDAVIIMAAVLYCLTILFTLKISMLGRLGGINHITRAFFWSLIFLVLIMPWQVALGWGLFGVTFEPSELVRRISGYESASVFVKALYWYRYVGHWVVALLCLIFAQIRTARWSKATLRRLEVI